MQVQFAKSVTLVLLQQMVSLCAGDRSSANGDATALQRPQFARHQWALGRLAELRRCPKHLPFLVAPSCFLFLYLLRSVLYQAAKCADVSKLGIAACDAMRVRVREDLNAIGRAYDWWRKRKNR